MHPALRKGPLFYENTHPIFHFFLQKHPPPILFSYSGSSSSSSSSKSPFTLSVAGLCIYAKRWCRLLLCRERKERKVIVACEDSQASQDRRQCTETMKPLQCGDHRECRDHPDRRSAFLAVRYKACCAKILQCIVHRDIKLRPISSPDVREAQAMRAYDLLLFFNTGWLKIKYPTGEYAISPQPVV